MRDQRFATKPLTWWPILLAIQCIACEPTWTRSSTTYCRWPCFGRRFGL